MESFNIQYTPVRRGLTGAEYLPQFLEENFSGVTFDSIISDGINYFGILSGTGQALSNSLISITGRFSVLVLTEDVLVGNCYNNYNPIAMDGETPPTFIEFMATHSITVGSSDILPAVKAAKIDKFKQISKSAFPVFNDTIADISKVVVLLNLHYDTLTSDQKTLVDNTSNSIKAIYTAEIGIAAYTALLADLQSILGDYYTAKTSVTNAANIEAANAIVYK